MKKMHLLAALTAIAVCCIQPALAQNASSPSTNDASQENVVTITPVSFISSGKAKFETNSNSEAFFAMSVTLVNNTFSSFQGLLVKTSDGTQESWPFPIRTSQTYTSFLPAGSYFVYILPLGGGSTPHTYSYNTGASSGSVTAQYAEWVNVNITSFITLTVHN